MKTIVISILFFVAWHPVLYGQDYYFRHYKVEDGLSHNTVMSSLQDMHGFLWFGTKNGLNRFDGYGFRLFQNDPLVPNSLKGNYVESLHEYDKTIWVGTDNGLFKYNERFENFDILENTVNRRIFDIENDNSGNLWYVAGGALHKYNTIDEKTIIYSAEDFSNAVDIIKAGDDEVWIATSNALFRYVSATNSFQEYYLDIVADIKRPLRINELFNLDQHTLLLGTQNHGVIAFDIERKEIKSIASLTGGNYYVRDFALREKNELWIATETGLFVHNLKTKNYIQLKKNYDNPYAISDNAVYSLMVDSEGGLWAGTYFGGINFHPKQYYPFKKFFPMSSSNSISGNAVREIQSDKYGILWIGTEDAGLNKYDPIKDFFWNIDSKENGGILSHHNIHGLLPRDDKLWVSLFDNGLDILDVPSGKIIKHFSVGGEEQLHNNFVFDLYETISKKVFAITTSGIETYDSKNNKFFAFEHFPPNLFYTCFIEDRGGILWAGTYSNGLYYHNQKTGANGYYEYSEMDQNSIAHNHINGIFQDSKNNIWVTTENGLNLLDKKKQNFRTYGKRDNFPSNVFYSILEDKRGKLWITTSNGLVEFNPENNDIKTYTEPNGLLTDQFNYNSAYKDQKGRMYFGSVNGMIRFDPSEFIQNAFLPPVFFTGLKINGKEAKVNVDGSPLKESITFTNNLKLKHSQSSFTIDFAALGFTAPKTTEYRYQLQGLNDDWINLKKKHYISFTELPSGTYTLIVNSLNNNKSWSKKTTSLHLEVLPVFWKSSVAYILYTSLTALIIFLSFKIYHQRIKAKNALRIKQLNSRKEKEIYHAKIEFFTNISHEIRTPLTLIKSPLEKVLEKVQQVSGIKDNLLIIERNTNRLLNLVNQLLDFRKTEIERMNLTFVETNIPSLIEQTYNRYREAIENKGINFKLDLGEKAALAYVDQEALKKIISNLFGNAIKYAKKNISVSLSLEKTILKLSIKNDGKLIPAHLRQKIFEPFFRAADKENQTGTGIGLALARSLTEMHCGTLRLITCDSLTNTFVLELPIHQEKEFRIQPEYTVNEITPDESSTGTTYKNGRSTILLVEDSEELLDFVAKELTHEYLVLKATNGEDALIYLQEENIQLVISDVMMPGMNGFTLCTKIKTNLESSHIPVILLTSKSTTAAKVEGLESGADAYMEKPFSMSHLKVYINNLIENRKHIIEHYASSPLAHIRSIANTKTDETFIQKLDNVIDENIADSDLNVETLAEIMNMSRSTLYRKIKDISNLTPNELINITRLKKSAELLKTKKYRIFEVAEIVGYNSATSFGRNFQKQFKMTPSEYSNNNLDI